MIHIQTIESYMELPSVIHPTKFAINGMYFQVISFSKLTDSQASKVAMHFYRMRKFKKSHKGKIFKVITTIDENSSGML